MPLSEKLFCSHTARAAMDTDRLQKTALQGYYNTKEKALQARFKIFCYQQFWYVLTPYFGNYKNYRNWVHNYVNILAELELSRSKVIR